MYAVKFFLQQSRTCLHSTPVDGGWICERWNRRLSSDEQRRGCPFHLFVFDLVPGQPVDAGDDADGRRWVDGTDAIVEAAAS